MYSNAENETAVNIGIIGVATLHQVQINLPQCPISECLDTLKKGLKILR